MSYRFGPGGTPFSAIINSLMNGYFDFMDAATGWTQYQTQKKANQVQIDYNQYMKEGNQRALDEWNKNVGSKGRTIKYPELSYPGSIYSYNSGISSAYFSNDIARANFYGSLPFRGAGLYGIAGRLSRFI